MNGQRFTVRARCLAPALLTMVLTGVPGLSGQPASESGRLDVVWGDPALGVGAPGAPIAWYLTTDEGDVLALDVPDTVLTQVGGLMAVRTRRVTIDLIESAARDAGGRLRVRSMRLAPDPLLPDPEPAAVTGSRPGVSILCRFSDIEDEPRSQQYFLDLYGGDPGELDHFWREVSYEIVNIVGSTATDWLLLPGAESDYSPPPEGTCSTPDHTALFDDCTAAADALIDFSNGGTGGYDGINLMFNGDIGGCAWGGSRWATLDGVTKSWRTTWEPPWGYSNQTVMGHEMGHGFGLPHSNNSDDDGWPYDNPWDVMSDTWSWALVDPDYGTLGKHTIGWHKDVLGWFAPSEVFTAGYGSPTIDIDQIALPSTLNYRMAELPIGGSSTYYTVEVRDRVGGYDGNLPGNAVIIHEIFTGRGEPAWIVDQDDPPANRADTEGVMWRVGETYVTPGGEYSVRVESATANGFRVTLDSGSALLSVSRTGGGSGQVVSIPAGVDCGSDCDGLFVSGSGVSLLAIPDLGSTFDGFSGDADCGDGAVLLSSDRACIAAFGECVLDAEIHLAHQEIFDVQEFEACNVLHAGEGGFLVLSGGDVSLAAGNGIALHDGFVVESGGSLVVTVGPSAP